MNKLKKYFFLLVLITLCLGARAQGGGSRPYPRPRQIGVNRPNAGKRLEAVKKGYISQQLNLTAAEAVRFWPLYDQYQTELNEVLKLRRANNMAATSNDGTESFDRDLSYQQRIINIQKHYREEFLKVLPPEKVSQLYKAESDFKFELLRRLKEGQTPTGN